MSERLVAKDVVIGWHGRTIRIVQERLVRCVSPDVWQRVLQPISLGGGMLTVKGQMRTALQDRLR